MLLLLKLISCLPEIQGYSLLAVSRTQSSERHMLFICSMCNKKTSPKYDVKQPLAGLSFHLGSLRLV